MLNEAPRGKYHGLDGEVICRLLWQARESIGLYQPAAFVYTFGDVATTAANLGVTTL